MDRVEFIKLFLLQRKRMQIHDYTGTKNQRGYPGRQAECQGRFNGHFTWMMDDWLMVHFLCRRDNRMSFVDSAENEVIRPGRLRFVPAEQSPLHF